MMSTTTAIAWTDATWNPLRGCSHVSTGCDHCYAERMAARFNGPGMPYAGLTRNGRWTGEVRVVVSALDQPLRWQRPRRIFVNSMSDLFHPAVSDETIGNIYRVMAECPQHIFQIATKRPERIGKQWASGPNVHLLVSVEHQRAAELRLPLLLNAAAVMRGVSAEPLLGPVDLTPWLRQLQWVVVGGESGPNARPCHTEWIRGIIQQCQRAHVPCFVKQLGANYVDAPNGIGGPQAVSDLMPICRLRHPKGGDMTEWPEELRVRQWP